MLPFKEKIHQAWMLQRAFIAALGIQYVCCVRYIVRFIIGQIRFTMHGPMYIKIVRYTLYQYAKYMSPVVCLAFFDVHKAGLINVFNLYTVNCLVWNDVSKHVAFIMRPTVIEFVVCDGTCEYCEQNLAWLLFLAVSALPSWHFGRQTLIRSRGWQLCFLTVAWTTETITVSVALWVCRQEMLDDVPAPTQPDVMRLKQQCTAVSPAWQFWWLLQVTLTATCLICVARNWFCVCTGLCVRAFAIRKLGKFIFLEKQLHLILPSSLLSLLLPPCRCWLFLSFVSLFVLDIFSLLFPVIFVS